MRRGRHAGIPYAKPQCVKVDVSPGNAVHGPIGAILAGKFALFAGIFYPAPPFWPEMSAVHRGAVFMREWEGQPSLAGFYGWDAATNGVG